MKKTPPPPPAEETTLDINTVADAAVTRQFKNLLAKIKKGSISPSEMKLFAELEKRIKATQGNSRVIYSQKEAAAALKRTERTVWEWKRQGMPMQAHGGFNLDEIEKWLSDRKQKRKKQGPGDKTDIEFWKLELKKHKAKLAELELKLKRGDLLVKADVMTGFRELQSYVKKHLALIPRTAPGKLTGLSAQGMQTVLSELTGAILTNMSKGQNASTLKGKLK